MPGVKLQGLNIIILIFLFNVVIVAACDNTICSDLGTTRVNISFNDLVTRHPKSFIVDSIVAAGSDSIFFAGDTLITCSLPVNTSLDSTVFFFFNSDKTDTLVIRYHRELKILSRDCGYSDVYNKVNAGYSTFPGDSSGYNELSLTNDSNIKIYF